MEGSGYPGEEAKKALIGLSRDLRGVAYSSNTRNAYMMFFDWMYALLFNLLLTTAIYYYLNLIDIQDIHQY